MKIIVNILPMIVTCLGLPLMIIREVYQKNQFLLRIRITPLNIDYFCFILFYLLHHDK